MNDESQIGTDKGGDQNWSKVKTLVTEVAEGLFSMSEQQGRLIFPSKRDGCRRVSEQEAKILACVACEKSDWWYSVETPTTERYSQKGETTLSARLDLTLYGRAGDRQFNIEFKAHNPRVESFRKDLEKLVCEDVPGIWFHLLQAENAGTRPALVKKIEEALTKINHHLRCRHHAILFVICVLPPKRGLYCYRMDLSRPITDELGALRHHLSPK